MESLSKTSAADATREKQLHQPLPSRVGFDSLSLPSYKEYPDRRPFINTLVHHTPQNRRHNSYRPPSPSRACPETSHAVILSALRNLQEKILRLELELEKRHGELGVHTMGDDVSHSHLQSETMTERHSNIQTDESESLYSSQHGEIYRYGRYARRETGDQSNCNQAAAESRCVKLERQRNAKAERTSLLREQVSMETTRSADQQRDSVSERTQLEKLEQEYLRLTSTQNQAEMKICELERKLQEEKRERKLLQDKANQLQTVQETSRFLLQSMSSCLPTTRPKDKKSSSKKSSPHQLSCTQPHYRVSLRDVPFVAGTSVGCSHSVRANVQSVLSLQKRPQLHLCNSRVLANNPNSSETGSRRQSDSSSSSSSSGDELAELLQALQEELRLMSLEQDELIGQLETSVTQQERRELQREQEKLLLKMERKGEQISKLYKHRKQIKKLRKDVNTKQQGRNEARVATAVSTRGRSAGPVKLRPGEKRKRNLRLLRDMKALQTSSVLKTHMVKTDTYR